MAYTMKVIRKMDQHTTNWSGGTTTEVAVYPFRAKYSQRDFVWRLSSAQIDDEQSTFTSLPGISRVLMVIDGVLTLDHEGHYRVQLQAFEQDRFSGDWTTKSLGKVRDFNLMMSQGCQGKLRAVTLDRPTEIRIPEKIMSHNWAVALYCVDGTLQLIVDRQRVELGAGDMILFEGNPKHEETVLQLSNLETQKVQLICADMRF